MEEKRFKPMADRLLIKADELPEKTKGGLYLPTTGEKEPSTIGTVVQVGTGLEDRPFVCKIGDRVMFSKFAGSDIELGEGNDKEKFKVIKEHDILGFLTDKGEITN